MSELPFMHQVPVGLTRLEKWKSEQGVETWQWSDELGWNAEKVLPDRGNWVHSMMAEGPTETEACLNLAKKLNLPWSL